MRRGVPVVVSAPSGGGKTTLCRRLLAELPGVEFSVSHTTRPRRGAERDGVDYYFVDDATFDRLVATDVFLEWARVHGHRYGTARAGTADRLERGIDVLFDIDVQGGRQIRDRLPETVLVFVVPPDLETLARRLRGRGSDADDVIERRLAAARAEIRNASFYDYWLINDDLEQASVALQAIVLSERMRRTDRQALQARLLEEKP